MGKLSNSLKLEKKTFKKFKSQEEEKTLSALSPLLNSAFV